MKTFKATVINEKPVLVKGKEKIIKWFALYEMKDEFHDEFVDIVKMWDNKNIKDLKVGDDIECSKGFNKDTRETFLYNITKL